MSDDQAPLVPPGPEVGALVLMRTSVLHRTWELTTHDSAVARLHDRLLGGSTGDLACGAYVISRIDRHGAFTVTTEDGRAVASFA